MAWWRERGKVKVLQETSDRSDSVFENQDYENCSRMWVMMRTLYVRLETVRQTHVGGGHGYSAFCQAVLQKLERIVELVIVCNLGSQGESLGIRQVELGM